MPLPTQKRPGLVALIVPNMTHHPVKCRLVPLRPSPQIHPPTRSHTRPDRGTRCYHTCSGDCDPQGREVPILLIKPVCPKVSIFTKSRKTSVPLPMQKGPDLVALIVPKLAHLPTRGRLASLWTQPQTCPALPSAPSQDGVHSHDSIPSGPLPVGSIWAKNERPVTEDRTPANAFLCVKRGAGQAL